MLNPIEKKILLFDARRGVRPESLAGEGGTLLKEKGVSQGKEK